MEQHFYSFLEPVSKELSKLLAELERAIYKSPRFMITHSRTAIEAIMEKVMIHENMENASYLTIHERIQMLQQKDLLTEEVLDALHKIRKAGNIAAHDVREFRFSESLLTWERIYVVVKWFVEVYEATEIEVPAYEDPIMQNYSYGLEELRIRMERFEELLKKSIQLDSENTEEMVVRERVDTYESKEIEKELEEINYEPGLTPVRTIFYKDEKLKIPHFLRDAFLLPQRFPNSVRYVRRLNQEQEARIMSELPEHLDHFHDKITHYDDSHTEIFFEELKEFINEEIRRKKLSESRPGELFLFYKGEEIVVTETFGKIEIRADRFQGAPGMIRQLREDGITKVEQLPKEFVIIEKYKGVGEYRVQKFFEQLKELQQKMIEVEVG